MTFLILLLAACAGALFHFSFRKSLDGGGRSNVFQLIQCFFTFLVVTLINVRPSTFAQFDFTTLHLGFAEGLLYVAMMLFLGVAFKKGPPGMTVATFNSASVIPAILMAAIFGAAFGHGYSLFNGIGSFLVVTGLFMASRTSVTGNLKLWAIFVLAAFGAHSVYLSIFQWRALLLAADEPLPHLNFNLEALGAQWFQPFLFLTAFLILALLYLARDRKPIQRRDILWGSLGGVGNGLCTFSLVFASEIATGKEKAMIFPIAGVLSILICNGWGKWLYKEKVNWIALSICLLGIIIGTIDWSRFL